MRRRLAACLLFVACPVLAVPPPADAPGDAAPVPPRLAHVLDELSITDAQRSAVRAWLAERRAARAQAQAVDRDAARAALRRIVNPDQAVAIEAALPPPGPPGRPGPRGCGAPRRPS
jgi:hypothetical protein